MIKDELRQREMGAYLALRNDLESGRVAHAYLLYGEKNPLLLEAAFLLAMSIIEDRGDFACESCNTCRRIRDGRYSDVVFIDGRSELIRKDSITELMELLSKTALEKSGKKVYIIANIQNSTPKVLNMILKTIEEPGSEDSYAIFTSDNIDSVLETVVSRCKKVRFLTKDNSFVEKELLKRGFDKSDAFLLANGAHDCDRYDLSDTDFLTARDLCYRTAECLDDKEYLPILFSRELESMCSKDHLKEVFPLYISFMTVLLEYAITKRSSGIQDIDRCIAKLADHSPERLLDIYLRVSEKTDLNLSRALLFDQISFEIIYKY